MALGNVTLSIRQQSIGSAGQTRENRVAFLKTIDLFERWASTGSLLVIISFRDVLLNPLKYQFY